MSNTEIIAMAPNQMRCMMLYNKNNEHIGSGVVFHDGVIVIHRLSGETMTYPDNDACEQAIDPEYNWCRTKHIEVDNE